MVQSIVLSHTARRKTQESRLGMVHSTGHCLRCRLSGSLDMVYVGGGHE